ncbi:hypothetical protein ACLB2K_026125 [Fragaria x ananassa]
MFNRMGEQRNPNHDDDSFIDNKYIKDEEYSDQIEEDDDLDDSDYHEAAQPPESTASTHQRPRHPPIVGDHRLEQSSQPPPDLIHASAINSSARIHPPPKLRHRLAPPEMRHRIHSPL